MSSQQPLPPKKEVALALLERSSVHLHLDPRVDGVVVPAWFKKQPQLVLQIGLNMPVPIPDLRLDDDGMSCTLSFNRSPFYCIVPWSSIFAMVGDDMRGMVWPDDMPPEVAQQASTKPPTAQPEPARKEAPPKRTLREVPPPSIVAAPPAPAAPATKAKRTRKKATPAAARTEAPRTPVGVPSPPPSKPTAIPTPRALPSPVTADNGTQDGPSSPHAPQASRGPARKPKRELPPYLRVVK
jgi:stringent starvation protein B